MPHREGYQIKHQRMSHGMNNAKSYIGEAHAGNVLSQAICVRPSVVLFTASRRDWK